MSKFLVLVLSLFLSILNVSCAKNDNGALPAPQKIKMEKLNGISLKLVSGTIGSKSNFDPANVCKISINLNVATNLYTVTGLTGDSDLRCPMNNETRNFKCDSGYTCIDEKTYGVPPGSETHYTMTILDEGSVQISAQTIFWNQTSAPLKEEYIYRR